MKKLKQAFQKILDDNLDVSFDNKTKELYVNSQFLAEKIYEFIDDYIQEKEYEIEDGKAQEKHSLNRCKFHISETEFDYEYYEKLEKKELYNAIFLEGYWSAWDDAFEHIVGRKTSSHIEYEI